MGPFHIKSIVLIDVCIDGKTIPECRVMVKDNISSEVSKETARVHWDKYYSGVQTNIFGDVCTVRSWVSP